MKKIFIDGGAGTTGLRLVNRLKDREDLEILLLPDEIRKDVDERLKMIKESDVSFLCLPDAASKEICEFAKDIDSVIIDTSTAHRVSDGWTYGFAEVSGLRQKIASSNRIANPGCHASGFVSLVNPLVEAGILSKGVLLTAFSLTGYTGGGKKMIASYEDTDNRHNTLFDDFDNTKVDFLQAPRQYGIAQVHKHLPEMKKICMIDNEPIFSPIVADYPCGMEVTVPIFRSQINGTINDIKEVYKKIYKGPMVKYVEDSDELGFLTANLMSGYDNMEISVHGNEDRILLVSRFDNLGKGASGAAIQNMNIVLGVNETCGLNIK